MSFAIKNENCDIKVPEIFESLMSLAVNSILTMKIIQILRKFWKQNGKLLFSKYHILLIFLQSDSSKFYIHIREDFESPQKNLVHLV